MHLWRSYLWDFDPESNFQGYRSLETRMGSISLHSIRNNRSNDDDPLSFCERISDHSRNFTSHLFTPQGCLLYVLSDSVIAIEEHLPWEPFLFTWTFYYVGQWLITLGFLRFFQRIQTEYN